MLRGAPERRMTPVVKSTYHKQRRRVPVSGLLAIWAVLASYDFNYRSLNGYWPAGSAATGSRGRTGSARSLLFNRAAGIALQPFGASPGHVDGNTDVPGRWATRATVAVLLVLNGLGAQVTLGDIGGYLRHLHYPANMQFNARHRVGGTPCPSSISFHPRCAIGMAITSLQTNSTLCSFRR